MSSEVLPAPAPWSGATAMVDRAAAVDRLPGTAEQDPFQRLAAAFLVAYPRQSARAYLADLKAWAAWCAAVGVHPFDACRHHVDAWIRALSTRPLPRTGKPMAAASIARVYFEEEFDDPRAPSSICSHLYIGPQRASGTPLLEVMLEVRPPRGLHVFHVMEARQKHLARMEGISDED